MRRSTERSERFWPGRGTSRLALTLGAVVGACSLLTLASVANAHRGYANDVKQAFATSDLPCDSYFSTPEISKLGGTAMTPTLNGQGKPVESWTAGPGFSMWTFFTVTRITGSECAWENRGNAGLLGDGDFLQAWAAVGYGESLTDWKGLWAHHGPAFTSEEGTPTTTSRVNLGHGSQAYVQKIDLWQETGSSYFTPPKYLYAVTVLTKHDNVLLLAPETASLGSVESALENVLATHPSL
jgi:hypothetical protein